MLQSMTAFAQYEFELSGQLLAWEIKTINHRFLEPQFKLPFDAYTLEPRLRQVLKQRLSRGKVDCVLKIKDQDIDGAVEYALNRPVVDNLLRCVHELNEVSGELVAPEVRAFDILRWPGAIQDSKSLLEGHVETILESFEHAMDALIRVREGEGQVLASFLLDRIEHIKSVVDKIETNVSIILSNYSDKIRTRVNEISSQVDESRLEQELVYMAQKMDIQEEITRLKAHLDKIKQTIQATDVAEKAKGKTLDFYMQELNREANTICSKSQQAELSQCGVELKVCIEQMREQIQNIQ